MYSSALIAIDREDDVGSQLLAERCRSFLALGPIDLHLIHVRTPLPRSYLAELPSHWEENDQSEAEAWLKDFAKQHGLSTNVIGTYAPSGSIAREAVRLAKELSVAAIFATAHRLDLGRLLLGSNVQAIARDAPCDVVVIRKGGN